MRKQILTTGVVLFCLGFVLFSFVLPLKATAASFSQIYVFGDSLSDDGNVFQASGNTFPPQPYFQGRFSNGPVWVEQLASLLKLAPNPDTNFAFGGATTGTDNTLNTSSSPLPGLQQEINNFTTTLKTAQQSADPNALYIVWAGGNDYLPTISSFQPFTQPEQPVKNLSNAVTSLAEVGAKNIMVVSLGNLGELPLTLGSPLSEPLNALTTAHNFALAARIKDLSQQLGSNLNIISFNVNSLFSDVVKDPGKFRFTNVTDSCFNQDTLAVCANPDEYLFWDRLHPTTATHKLIAESAYATLASVPEPAYGRLGTLAFGTCSVFLVLKRQQKKVSRRLKYKG